MKKIVFILLFFTTVFAQTSAVQLFDESRQALSNGNLELAGEKIREAIDADKGNDQLRKEFDRLNGLRNKANNSNRAVQDGRFGDAIVGFKEVLDSIPKYIPALFGLAKAYEGDKDFNESFAWYKKANDLRPNLNFNQKDHKSFCEGIIEGFDSDTLQNQAIKQDGKPIPIFIIGMPRSGSTLIEQILSSHSKIEGTMELMTLPNLERKMIISGGQNFDKKYPESFKYFNKEQLSDFGQEYLNQTSIYRTDKPYFIDKLPPNFERVGVIHKILPNAIIIDARRHPLACGFSIYKQHFAGGYEFSYDLENIGHYYNSYLSVMDHFNKVLPYRIFLAQYEDTINDLEHMTRRLLSYIKLDFESSCLEFYKNKRPVRTASSEQVRQPIYTQSIEAWKQYENRLEPLKKALGTTTLKRFN